MALAEPKRRVKAALIGLLHVTGRVDVESTLAPRAVDQGVAA